MTVYRPGHHLIIPGARVSQPGGAEATPWYLSGGIAAANCLAAYTPKGAASLAASYDNNAAPGNGLPDGTYDAAPGVAPTWAAGTGWTFNGTTQYLTTGVIPASQNQSFLVCYSGATTAGAGFVFGMYSPFSGVQPNRATEVGYWNGGSTMVAPALQAGTVGVSVAQAYRNGVAEGGAIANAGWPGLMDYYIGACNNNGVAAYFCKSNVLALAIYAGALTAPQMLAVSAAMAAL